MIEEKEEGEKGTFGEVVMGMVLLGVLCFIGVEMFVAGIFGVMIGDCLYAIGIVVVAITIIVGLRWWRWRGEEDNDD